MTDDQNGWLVARMLLKPDVAEEALGSFARKLADGGCPGLTSFSIRDGHTWVRMTCDEATLSLIRTENYLFYGDVKIFTEPLVTKA